MPNVFDKFDEGENVFDKFDAKEVEQGHDFSVKEMAKNIPGSALNVGKDIYNAVRHPQQTKNAITGLASGAISKLIPGKQPQEEYADAFWGFVTDRYGGIDNIKKTVEKDPVGFAMDVASLASGSGAALKGGSKIAGRAGKFAKFGEKIDTVGDVAVATGKALDPSTAISKAADFATGSLPEAIYKRAAKFQDASLSPKERISAVKTALKESIPLSRNGVDKLWTKISNIDQKVKDIIETGKYKTASMEEINSHIDDVIGYYQDIPDSQAKIKYLENLKKKNVNQFTKNPSAEQMHRSKKKVYELLRKSYDRQTPVKLIKEEGKMAFAKGAMEEIERLFPKVGELNKKEGEYLKLFKAITKAVPRIEKQNIGILNPINMGVGGTVGYATESALAGLSTWGAFLLLKDPVVQSKLAIALNKAGKVHKALPRNKSKIAFQAGRSDDWSGYDNVQ